MVQQVTLIFTLHSKKTFPLWERFFLAIILIEVKKMTQDLSKRVEQAAQGFTPQTKPDERRRYLGSLRERVLVRMNNTEIKDPNLTALFLEHIDDYQGYTVLINGNIEDNSFLGKIEGLCSQKNIPFTLINDDSAKTGPQDTAVLVVAKTAINKMRVEINQVYPSELPKEELTSSSTQKKGSFWHRLFHGNK